MRIPAWVLFAALAAAAAIVSTDDAKIPPEKEWFHDTKIVEPKMQEQPIPQSPPYNGPRTDREWFY